MTRPQHTPFDAAGRRIRPGDRVRVVGVPDLSGMAPASRAESQPVFERLVGTYRRITGFDELGHAEIRCRLRGGAEDGLHWVWIEPSLLRLPRARPTSRSTDRRNRRKGEPSS